MIMNNTGPTHPSPPDASPALNKMQERTEPPHQRAGRQQGTESEREKDRHPFTALLPCSVRQTCSHCHLYHILSLSFSL